MLRPALLTAFILAATALPGCWGQSISASIAKPKVGYVRVNEPVVLNFSQKIDAKSVKLALNPTTDFTIDVKDKKVLVTPKAGWHPAVVAYSMFGCRARCRPGSCGSMPSTWLF